MIKKTLKYLLVGWLINTLVLFHPVFADHTHHYPSEQTTLHTDNTLIEVILSELTNKDPKKAGHKKLLAKTRFISVRSANIDIILPQSVLSDIPHEIERVCFSQFKFWERKVFLPPHYNFLFRLSPF